MVITVGLGHATRQQQSLIDVRFALIARNPVGQSGLILDDAGREVRHYFKAFLVQTRGCGNHFLNRGALDMGDINAGAFGKNGAKVFNFRSGARHYFNRITLQKGFDFKAKGASDWTL